MQKLLKWASKGNEKKFISYVKQHPGVVEERTEEEESPLHIAVRYSLNEGVCAILQAKGDVNAQDQFLQTPLHLAARRHLRAMVKLLLLVGADPNIQDLYGNTPLQRIYADYPSALSVRIEREFVILSIIEALLDHKADVTKRNDEGNTVLHLWACVGAYSALLMVLRRFKYNDDWTTDCLGDGTSSVRLKPGSSNRLRSPSKADNKVTYIDVDEPNGVGMTPLHLACVFRQKKIVELMFMFGATPTIPEPPAIVQPPPPVEKKEPPRERRERRDKEKESKEKEDKHKDDRSSEKSEEKVIQKSDSTTSTTTEHSEEKEKRDNRKEYIDLNKKHRHKEDIEGWNFRTWIEHASSKYPEITELIRTLSCRSPTLSPRSSTLSSLSSSSAGSLFSQVSYVIDDKILTLFENRKGRPDFEEECKKNGGVGDGKRNLSEPPPPSPRLSRTLDANYLQAKSAPSNPTTPRGRSKTVGGQQNETHLPLVPTSSLVNSAVPPSYPPPSAPKKGRGLTIEEIPSPRSPRGITPAQNSPIPSPLCSPASNGRGQHKDMSNLNLSKLKDILDDAKTKKEIDDNNAAATRGVVPISPRARAFLSPLDALTSSSSKESMDQDLSSGDDDETADSDNPQAYLSYSYSSPELQTASKKFFINSNMGGEGKQLLEEINPFTDIVLLRKVGEGASSFVYRAKHIHTSFEFALKKVKIAEETFRTAIQTELNLLLKLNHPNIVCYYGCFLEKEDLMVIMLEYCGFGSLVEVRKMIKLSDIHISSLLYFILQGLIYIHGQNIVYRDLKAQNVLMSEDGMPKIADFGVSKQLTEEGRFLTTSFIGTPAFMAPELLEGKNYSFSSDIWSLGITLIQLYDGVPPNSHMTREQLLHRTPMTSAPNFKQPDKINTMFAHFVSLCLEKDGNKRPSATQLVDHPFLKRSTAEGTLSNHMESISSLRKTVLAAKRERKMRKLKIFAGTAGAAIGGGGSGSNGSGPLSPPGRRGKSVQFGDDERRILQSATGNHAPDGRHLIKQSSVDGSSTSPATTPTSITSSLSALSSSLSSSSSSSNRVAEDDAGSIERLKLKECRERIKDLRLKLQAEEDLEKSLKAKLKRFTK